MTTSEGRRAARAILKYSETVCRDAFAEHCKGNGANTIAQCRAFGGSTRAADAAIDAGRFMHGTAYAGQYVVATFGTRSQREQAFIDDAGMVLAALTVEGCHA